MNAILPATVTQYLKRASPGVRAELHANLHQRMLDHLTAGLMEAQAWDAALKDFGPPTPAWTEPLRTGPLWLLLALGFLGGSAYAAATHLHLGHL